MMDDFAIVAEGISDHPIIENILTGYFQDQRAPVVIAQEPPDRNTPGGWQKVFRFLREKRYKAVFDRFQHLIIHVDTDVSQGAGFDVPHFVGGRLLSPEELVHQVIGRLQQEIGAGDLATYSRRFIYAVAVDEIECWMLPLWYQGANERVHAEKITGCLRALGHSRSLYEALDLKNLMGIGGDKKDYFSYFHASRGYRRRATLDSEGRKNPSLALFLAQLDNLNIVLPAEESAA